MTGNLGSALETPRTLSHFSLTRKFRRLYTTIQKYLMPLADLDAPPNSPLHPSSYPDFPAGHFVLALYPDTSCFYRAKVAEDREKVGSCPIGVFSS